MRFRIDCRRCSTLLAAPVSSRLHSFPFPLLPSSTSSVCCNTHEMYVYADQPTLGGYNSNAVRSGNGLGNRRSNAYGWGIFEEKTTASSWLASLGLQNDRRNGLSTSKYSSFWSNFHFFEAPRRRSLSSSSNAPPSMIKFCFLCAFWYSTSALSNNTGKAILNQFRYPITLTFVQFGFIAAYCLLFTSPLIRFTRLRRPTKAILESTLPMGLFQVGGHVFSSVAISRIPVSTVHTIKVCLSLFTCIAPLNTHFFRHYLPCSQSQRMQCCSESSTQRRRTSPCCP